MKTLKVIASLLHYPEAGLHTHAAELIDVVEGERRLGEPQREALCALIRRSAAADLLELQAEYVDTFDRGRARSLHLFEHVHGESRDRGQAMIDLIDVYRAAGFEIDCAELPDYLPLFLEFCAQIPGDDAREWLGQVAHILQLLHQRLVRRGSPYAPALEALLALAGADADSEAVRGEVASEAADDTPAALDRVWMEAPVTFAGAPNPAGAGCSAQTVHWVGRNADGSKL